MNGNLAEVIDLPARPELDLSAWAAWLKSQLLEDWRQGEWDGGSWLFTGDLDSDKTVAWPCIIDTCPVVHKSRNRRCKSCEDHFRLSGLTEEEFSATYRPSRNRVHMRASLCTVERDGARCQRELHSKGLCRGHSMRWIKASRAADKRRPFDRTLEEWIRDVAEPLGAWPDCNVAGCPLEQVTLTSGLCRIHYQWWSKHKGAVKVADLDAWIEHQTSYLASHQFSLAPLSDIARLEVLYALQQRDLRTRVIQPSAIRPVIRELTGVGCLLTAKPETFSPAGWHEVSNRMALLRDIAWIIERGQEQFTGIKPTDKLIWDMRAVNGPIGHRPGRSGSGSRSVKVDFTVIKQPWLRDALMEWARSTQPDSNRFRRRLEACVLTSTVLHRQPGGGLDPSQARFADMSLVVAGFRAMTKKDGNLFAGKHRADCLSMLHNVLDFGRRAGLLNDLHGTFGRHKSLRIVREESNEDEIGKAIPESVIRQLDGRLDGFDVGFRYRGYAEADIAAMFQAVYRVLRDTGRRPWEVVSLKRNCLEFAGNDIFLIWNNNKGKRLKRRLPITRDTAEDIQRWAAHRDGLLTPKRSEPYLFPAISDDGKYPHLTSSYLERAMRQWVQLLDRVDSEGTGRDGLPVPFDKDKIFPYAFRHSYAQRHADANVPIDVLKELMDHKSADTTARYYKVSLKRKLEAVKTMRLHVVDRHGNPAPMTSNRAYEMRSVAVPFGGCTEPSNVKAGGHACPIRFQCADCGFYRPDPSYLAAIEDQIRDLKADKETALAMGTDEYVIRNLQDQINSFKKVAANMHEQIEALPEKEREELMESVKVLRKSRAARGRMMLPLTVIRPGESSA
ncbi:tyrosine-type recombinase/integrase [Streptomyces acidiscabies]|uniref:tyrosine-type recombinase/integrase n=1 Tax=Streptomyces acidiscabies TaxID=42234 RepID=UPI00073F3E32|nr:site-specific integrase [Streptomyces acidiscabies]GAQ50321.1 site-specific tyrosine recombinase XerD [Streptomyces acidiscabies]